MIDNTPMRDEKRGPPFMHTALMTALELNYINMSKIWKILYACENPTIGTGK